MYFITATKGKILTLLFFISLSLVNFKELVYLMYYSDEGTRILTLHSALNRRSRAVSVESPAAVTPHHSLKWVVVRFGSGLFITSRIINLNISFPTTPATEATVISVGTRNCKIKK